MFEKPSLEQKNYSAEWFKNRAILSLRKISDGLWDYSDSLLFYMPNSDQVYENLQHEDDPYSQIVTVPEKKQLQAIAAQVVALLPNDFEYIDLGPGTEHKEQYIFDAAKQAGKNFVYRPVDISSRYLDFASQYAEQQNIKTQAIHSAFEELSEKIGESQKVRFVSLGTTFMNFEPQHIIELLLKIAGKSGFAFINPQLRERINIGKMPGIYSNAIKDVSGPKIRLLGLDPATDVASVEVDNGVRGIYELNKTNAVLDSVGVRPGDKLITFQSIRYSKEELEGIFVKAGVSYKILDIGSSFLGILLQK